MKKLVGLFLMLVLTLTSFNVVYAAEQPAFSKEFIKEAELSITRDDKGDWVILLSNVEEVAIPTSSNEKTYAKTTVAILGENEKETANILEDIQELKRGAGQYNEEGWFYGSSIYLSLTVYYTTTPINDLGFSAISLNSATMQCTTNSGSSVDSMTLTMIQHGPCYPDNIFRTQSRTFNAITTRSFNAPSSWYSVDMSSGLTAVSSAIDCTATRPGGSSSTFRLVAKIIG